MHAYIYIGENTKKTDELIADFLKKKKLKGVDYELKKIDNVRELAKITKNKALEPTAFVIRDIGSATTETFNAFLKSLEEPPENTYFILTTSSKHLIPETILSRCMEIYVGKGEVGDTKIGREFVEMSVGEKCNFCTEIKERSDAIEFLTNVVRYLQSELKDSDKTEVLTKNAEMIVAAQKASKDIKSNSNVQLSLLNFVVSLV